MNKDGINKSEKAKSGGGWGKGVIEWELIQKS